MISKVYKIIDDIENSDLNKRLKDIKYEIKNNHECQKLIKKFNNSKELYERYNTKDEFIKSKKDLMNNDLIKKYLEIQNKINLISIYINKKIYSINNNITCKK